MYVRSLGLVVMVMLLVDVTLAQIGIVHYCHGGVLLLCLGHCTFACKVEYWSIDDSKFHDAQLICL